MCGSLCTSPCVSMCVSVSLCASVTVFDLQADSGNGSCINVCPLLQKGTVAQVTLSLAPVVTRKSVIELSDSYCTFLPVQVVTFF